MINETILAIIIAFAISAVLCPIVIPFLHKLKFGQQVREDGPQAHLKKAGTPTMGGLIILGSIIITSMFYLRDYPKMIPVLFVTVGFGIIGFLDDYIKIVMKRSEGLNPGQKLAGQIVITGIFIYYLMNSGEVGTAALIPFTGGFDGGYFLDFGIFYVHFVFVVMLGTDMIFMMKPATAGTSMLMAKPMTMTLPLRVTPSTEKTSPSAMQTAKADR